MRQGELLALQWADVDLDGRVIVVRHTLQRVVRALAEPKTDASRRTLRIPDELATALREHRRRQLEARLAAAGRWKDQDYVFAGPRGDAWHARNVLADFKRTLASACLPPLPFHALRHVYATLQIEQGEDLGIVSKLLGPTEATTLDVYAHLTPAMGERAAARMDEILRANPATG